MENGPGGFFLMKFAVAASAQSNKKPVELFLIGFHSCGFLYTNRHPAEQKKKSHFPPRTSFQLQIISFLHQFSH